MKKPRQAKLTRSFLIRRSEYRLGLANQFFFDSSSLTGQIAQVVEFGAADVTVALNFDAGNQRRIELECTFHTFTAGNLTNGESRVQTAVANGDDNAFESLNTLAGTFNDVDVNDNRCRPGSFSGRFLPSERRAISSFSSVSIKFIFVSNDHLHAALLSLKLQRGWILKIGTFYDSVLSLMSRRTRSSSRVSKFFERAILTKSGRVWAVICNACLRVHAWMFLWCPLKSTSGTGISRQTSGRV